MTVEQRANVGAYLKEARERQEALMIVGVDQILDTADYLFEETARLEQRILLLRRCMSAAEDAADRGLGEVSLMVLRSGLKQI